MSGPSATTSFAERVGGRWAVSVRGFLITVGIGFAGAAAELVRKPRGDWFVLIAATAFSFGVVALMAGVFHRTRWADRRVKPVPMSEVLAVNALSGLPPALAFAATWYWFGVGPSMGPVAGLVAYPAISLWASTSVIVYLDLVDRARMLRARVVDEHATALRIRGRSHEAVDRLTTRIDSILDPAMDHLRKVASEVEPQDVSAEIRDVVEGSVREVSHDLWNEADGAPSRIGAREVLGEFVRRPRFRPWPMIGIAVVLPLFGNERRAGWVTFVIGGVAALVLYVECRLANRALRQWTSWRVLVVMTTIAVFVTQSIVIDRVAVRWGEVPNGLGVGSVVALTLLLVVVSSTFGSYRDLDDQRATAMAADIRADRLEAMAQAKLVSDETRRLAALLHGRVQSRLLGCAMAIEFAGDDPVALQAAIDRTTAVLSEDWHDMESPDDDRRNGSLVDALAPWQGLARVDVSGPVELQSSTDPDLVVVVEELVANAIRHGAARHVRVNLESDGSTCVITVIDGGTGGSMTRPGLGTALLERVGSVDRRIGDDGWSVTVRLARRGVESTPTI